tara:strand:- start:950 stop:1666 length:717 start_codon:yes stop_codon:yes gene_type:complete
MKLDRKSLMERAGIKALNEGYAWERNEDGSLPTLADATAKHQANLAESEDVNEADLNFIPLDDTTHHIVFKKPEDAERKLDDADIDYDNVGFVFPKMTRETWMTIKDLFDTRDVGDMGQHNESVDEAYDWKSRMNPNHVKSNQQIGAEDMENLKSAAVSISNEPGLQGEDLLGAVEDGYYALADNLPNLVNDLQKAYNILKAKHKDQHHSEVIAVSRELEIFKNIEALIDGSVLGAVL